MIQINDEHLQSQYDSIKSYLSIYDSLGQPLIDEYASDLDKKVDAINMYLKQIEEFNLEFDVPSLQRMVMELSSVLYYTSSKLEQVSLLANMAKINYKSKYNDAYTSKQEAATVDKRKYTSEQLRAMAEQEALEEELVNFIYDHVEDVLRSKVDSGYELLKGISKSLSASIESMKQFGMSVK